ncbi:alpha/beta hydrolase [Paenibacillus sp. HN-1]|uniref:alpha/beta hydrolase family protein n=1 Tax=Paenibacillus TaxID=44249 RepID=UPI001CA93D14|nr:MULTISPECIES: alpha/beta hydrolase [Paenibacillus]MBY9080028.1 alpha/beta hydrolase [Paenibacillus sp. CGMCC 1.18879]MBY9086726.1 alpha/beta hydrolase [Paenibacillus sinensis]
MNIELRLPPAPPERRRHRRAAQWLARRLRDTARYDTPLWRGALLGPWLIGFAAFTAVLLGMPTGFGRPFDLMLAAAAAAILLAAAGYPAAALLSLLGLRLPRLFAACVLASTGAVLVILLSSDIALPAAAATAAAAGAAAAIGGWACGLIRTGRRLPGLALLAALAGALLLIPGGPAFQAGFTAESGADDRDEAGSIAAAGTVDPLTAPNPGLPGSYAYRTFTYGSGSDRHRPEFGAQAELISETADASSYTSGWTRLRTWFWGFGPDALPLNGRVWMPEGDGPFPLVLIVHGNHSMEEFSDSGYAYLGELLASRGFIAISVDENFLNYSAWSGIPENDYKLRAWIILKHLEQLAAYGDTPGNPFYGKIDYSRTALIGHSRGGQAVAMATDAERWFSSDPVLLSSERFRISAVAALAPTDQTVDGEQAELQNISYLTLHGAHDGDVHNFYGDRQYVRAFYLPDSTAFKSSLYIGGANHSQFNTGWGLNDLSPPAGLFLSRSDIMEGDEQRRIAKVYIGAFLETTLHGNRAYSGLFQDYRSGLSWLPAGTSYFNRYQDGALTLIAGFDEDRDSDTADLGASAASAGLRITEEIIKDRDGGSKDAYGVRLERSTAPDSKSEGYYRLSLQAGPVIDQVLSEAEGFTFSMSNLNGPTGSESPEIDIELTDTAGAASRVSLSSVMTPLPLPQTRFTRSAWLEKQIAGGKFVSPTEDVFQTYRIPIALFRQKNAAFDPAHLKAVTFYLRGGGDSVMLDDIGFYGGQGSTPLGLL